MWEKRVDCPTYEYCWGASLKKKTPTTQNKKHPVLNNNTVRTNGSITGFKLLAVPSYFVARSWRKVQHPSATLVDNTAIHLLATTYRQTSSCFPSVTPHCSNYSTTVAIAEGGRVVLWMCLSLDTFQTHIPAVQWINMISAVPCKIIMKGRN